MASGELYVNQAEAINFYDRYDISDHRSESVRYDMSKLKNRKRTQNTDEDQKRSREEEDIQNAWDMLDSKQLPKAKVKVEYSGEEDQPNYMTTFDQQVERRKVYKPQPSSPFGQTR